MSLVQIARPSKGVVQLILNNPSKLNMLSVEMGEAFRAAVEETRADSSLRCVVLSGAGKAFSAGGDLAFLRDRVNHSSEANARTMLQYYERFLSVRKLPVPVISAIDGAAVGAGACLAMATDVRLVAARARLGFNFARLGIHAGMAATHFLPQLLGNQVASRLLLTGELITGAQAAQWGLAAQVFQEAEEVLPAALDMAAVIAGNSPVAVQSMVSTLRAHGNEGLEKALQREADAQAQCYQVDDLREGLDAVVEKRDPSF